MKKQENIVGIDIGSYEIKAVVGNLNEKGIFQITGFSKIASSSIDDNSFSNVNKLFEDLENLIILLENQIQDKIETVRIGLSGIKVNIESHKEIMTRKIVDNEINIDDINSLKNDAYKSLIFSNKSIINIIAQKYKVDYKSNINDPIGMRGIRLECDYKIITVENEIISNIKKVFDKLQKKIEYIGISSILATIVSLYEEEKEEGVCLIDFGKSTTKISIFYNSIFENFLVLNLGSDLISKDIKYAFNLSSSQAENIKIQLSDILLCDQETPMHIEIPAINNKFSKNISISALQTVVSARVTEIIFLIKENIKKIELLNKIKSGIVLVGGGAKLKGISEIFEKTFEVETRIGRITEKINLDNNFPVYFDYYQYLNSVAVAVSSYKSIDSRENKFLGQIKENNSFREKNKPKDDKNLMKKILNIWEKTKNILVEE
jgi:cell division protein FtsA